MSEIDAQLLLPPAVPAPLDPDFRPIALGNRRYRQAAEASSDSEPCSIALERNDGQISVFRTPIFATRHREETAVYVERLVKFLLWQAGGWKVMLGGPKWIADHIRQIYSSGGARAFDVKLMESVYERTFCVEHIAYEDTPLRCESSSQVGGHLDGCRIGFDLGASDYKLAAVREGETVFATEIPWDPRIEANPEFHYRKIQDGLRLAASHLPRVDAIGGSSAGIYVKNRAMVASLFRAVPPELFEQSIKPLFLRLRSEWGVPFEVANDGDVTALAAALSLGIRGVLGVAMGSSQAAGFLDREGRITGWLNELAFAPVDYSPTAPVDEWSGDAGCGALYFSQQAVVRLAPAAGIDLAPAHPAEQLKHVQELQRGGDSRADRIFETIGVYFGYGLAHYASVYELEHVLVLGRVTSGPAGEQIVNKAREALRIDFPDLADRIQIHLPDEKSKRLGQAMAAASLPALAATERERAQPPS